MASAPPPTGVRFAWTDLPVQLRAEVAAFLGSPVVATATRPTGFSPGAALRVESAGGDVAFLKAIGPEPNPTSADFHRREIEVTQGLAGMPFVPALRWTYDHDGWVALLFDYVDAENPPMPWRRDDLMRVLAAVTEMHDLLTPSPVEASTVLDAFRNDFTGWQAIAAGAPPSAGLDEWTLAHLDLLADVESRWADVAAGETLLHADLRGDNLLLAADRVYVVDWPWACRGAAWLDVAWMAPSVTMYGGPQPAEVMELYAAANGGSAPSPEELAPIVAAIGGFFVEKSLRPAQPGLPTVRAFQAAQGVVCRAWLRELLN